jgi:hypothetical protein
VDRERPYSVELVLQVPPKSHLEISVGFEYSLLKWLEYPPGKAASAVNKNWFSARKQRLGDQKVFFEKPPKSLLS